MLADISNVDAIYIVCGRTDMRKSIDGLCTIIQEQFSMEIDHSLYLFCGHKCDRIKALKKNYVTMSIRNRFLLDKYLIKGECTYETSNIRSNR